MKDRRLSTALSLVALVAGMVMLTAASVPLYRIFCQVTGFGGTTGRAAAAPAHPIARTMRVQFEAYTDAALPWEFRPGERGVTLHVGQQRMTYFVAKNTSNKPVTGRAVYNVVPHEAGAYFDKIQCFCFSDQTLQPGQEVQMPVVFFVDPAIVDDHELDDVHTITLSYTFFPATSASSAP